jgi:CheY-like chemotaxis protein
MDRQMTVINEYEATRAIRNINSNYCKNIPIVVVMENSFPENIERSMNYGVNKHT